MGKGANKDGEGERPTIEKFLLDKHHTVNDREQ